MSMSASATPTPVLVEESLSDSTEFLSTVEGEIAFFRAITRARPVGIHRHFHILNIFQNIHKDTGHAVAIQAIWDKLRTLYDLDALETVDIEYESLMPNGSGRPVMMPSPSMNDNLAAHPFFREEYSLPYDQRMEEMLTERRIRSTPSPVSSPATPVTKPPGRTRAGRKRGKSKLDLAGLVGGDSDSSALTQESGDEGIPTPHESNATGTEGGGTEFGGDEDVEMRDASADPRATSPSSKPGRRKAVPAVPIVAPVPTPPATPATPPVPIVPVKRPRGRPPKDPNAPRPAPKKKKK